MIRHRAVGGVYCISFIRFSYDHTRKEEEINALHDTTTVVQTAWRVGKGAVEAGTNLVPVCVP
jgi:hypothetical protein